MMQLYLSNCHSVILLSCLNLFTQKSGSAAQFCLGAFWGLEYISAPGLSSSCSDLPLPALILQNQMGFQQVKTW